jgi:hypothetical protein
MLDTKTQIRTHGATGNLGIYLHAITTVRVGMLLSVLAAELLRDRHLETTGDIRKKDFGNSTKITVFGGEKMEIRSRQ